jgi:hypothetical protein
MSPEETANAENDALMDRLEKVACDLREHCDSVRIFCTIHRDDTKETSYFTIGKGNFYAQQGQVLEWSVCMDQKSRNSQNGDISD